MAARSFYARLVQSLILCCFASFFLSVVLSLAVSTGAINCLEMPITELACVEWDADLDSLARYRAVILCKSVNVYIHTARMFLVCMMQL